MKTKITKILFLSLLISIIIYQSKHINLMNSKILRKTLSSNGIDEICNKSKEGINELYTKSEYEYISKDKDEKYVDYLMKFLEDYEIKYLKDYSKKLLTIGIVLCLEALLIIFWVGYCICCGHPCCCCKNNGQKDTCVNTSFRIATILFLISIISCVLGMIYSIKFNQSINSTSCSIFRLYDHFISGDECSEKPVWNGINEINHLINQTEDQLNYIDNYTQTVINNSNDTNIPAFEFQNEPLSVNPYPEYERDNDSNDSNVYIALDEYKNKIEQDLFFLDKGFKLLKDLSDLADQIKKDKTKISESLYNSGNQLNDINNTFNTLSNDILDVIYDYQRKYNKYSNLFYLGTFGLLFICSILILISLMLFTICECQCPRYIFHFTYFFNMLFILIILIFGIIFGLISLIGKDSVGVMEEIISESNLNKTSDAVVLKGNGTKYLNVCFNSNGNLSSVLNLKLNNNGIDVLNQLYHYKSIVDDAIIVYQKYDFSSLNDVLDDEYKFYYEPQNDNKSIKDVLDTFRKYTDKKYNEKVKFSHFWVTNEKFCEVDSIKINPYNHLEEDANYCFMFNSISACLQTYNDITFDNGKNLCDIWLEYKNSINGFIENYLQILSELKSDYTSKLNDSKVQIVNGLKDSLNMIEPIYDIYNGRLSDDNDDIFSVLNCRFLKRDSRIFFDVLGNDLSKDSGFIEIFILVSCICSSLGIFFGLIIILRAKMNEENKKKIKLKNSIKKENLTELTELKSKKSEIEKNENEKIDKEEVKVQNE